MTALQEPENPISDTTVGFGKLGFKPKKTVFVLVFALVFLLSGLITLTGVIQYSMGLVSFLIIPLLFLFRIKITRVILAYVLLAAVILLSGLINQSTPLETLLFMRTLIFSFLIYALVELYLRTWNVTRVLRFCVLIGVIQLPIIFIQRFLYGQLPPRILVNVDQIDFDFGTFNFKGDYAMAFFISLIVAYLLFVDEKSFIIRGKKKWVILAWLTITVLVANAEIVKLIIGFVWLVYLVVRLNSRRAFFVIGALTIVVGILIVAGFSDEIWNDLNTTMRTNTTVDLDRHENFIQGNYSRGAAFRYYLANGPNFLGDGPSKYYNALTSTYSRGNHGHTLTFYAEVGLLGWLSSLLILYLFAFHKGAWIGNKRSGRIQIPWFSIVIFISILMLSITNHVMNDIGIMMVYLIVAKANTFGSPPFKEKDTLLANVMDTI